MKPIIQSLLDTDYYKFTMGNIAYSLHRNVNCKYKFYFRNHREFNISQGFVDNLNEQIESLTNVKLTSDEADYLFSEVGMDYNYIHFLKSFRFKKDYISTKSVDNRLELEICGPWHETILYEVPLLAIISECLVSKWIKSSGDLNQKLNFLYQNPFAPKLTFCEFGTRRRASREWHEYVFGELYARSILYPNRHKFLGTSNVKLSMDYGLKPIGTMAHEYLQAYQALTDNLEDFQVNALDDWAEFYCYQNKLTALTDVVGVKRFVRDFKRIKNINRFSSFRHDSGDPKEWVNSILDLKLSNSLELIFSDGLSIGQGLFDLHNYVEERSVNPVFAIGSDWTALDRYCRPNIVIKMVECKGRPVGKVTDSPGKAVCEDKEHLQRLTELYEYE